MHAIIVTTTVTVATVYNQTDNYDLEKILHTNICKKLKLV